MSGSTTLLLARHGDIEGIEPPRFRGRADPGLSRVGREQAERLARHIAQGWRLDRLFISPRARCGATAAPIAETANVDPVAWSELDDIDYGDWTWLTHEEAQDRQPAAFACWREHPELTRFPDGESLQDLLARAADALRRVVDDAAGQTVAFVTHDSVIRALMLQLTGLPLSFYHRLTISPCSLSEIVIEENRPTLVRLNETAHLISGR